MSFGSLGEFLGMGGHGLYVWLAYGAAVIVVVANVVSVRRAYRRTIRESRALEQRQTMARGGTTGESVNPITDRPSASAAQD
jgi:heme exporter protein D